MDIADQTVLNPFLLARLHSAGLSWDVLVERCEQIILFGSRAANVHSPDSDYDLLCIIRDKSLITSSDRRVTPGIDLVWISQPRLETAEWLGCELAQHVASYGRWLHGMNDWGHAVFSSECAILQKSTQIKERIEALKPRWDRLLPSYHRKYSRLVRRDLQRLQLMSNELAVSPSPLLDSAWRRVHEPLVDWARTNLEPGLVALNLLTLLPWQEQAAAAKSALPL